MYYTFCNIYKVPFGTLMGLLLISMCNLFNVQHWALPSAIDKIGKLCVALAALDDVLAYTLLRNDCSPERVSVSPMFVMIVGHIYSINE